jgi:hypothetical protein
MNQNCNYSFHMNAFDEVENLTKPNITIDFKQPKGKFYRNDLMKPNITINFEQPKSKFYRNEGSDFEWLPPGQTLTEDLKSVGRRMAVLAAGDVAWCRPTI